MAACSLLPTKAQTSLQSLLLSVAFLTVSAQSGPPTSDSENVQKIRGTSAHNARFLLVSAYQYISKLMHHRYVRAVNGQFGVWDMVQLIAFCGFIGAIGHWRRKRATQHGHPAAAGRSGLERPHLSIMDEHRGVSMGKWQAVWKHALMSVEYWIEAHYMLLILLAR